MYDLQVIVLRRKYVNSLKKQMVPRLSKLTKLDRHLSIMKEESLPTSEVNGGRLTLLHNISFNNLSVTVMEGPKSAKIFLDCNRSQGRSQDARTQVLASFQQSKHSQIKIQPPVSSKCYTDIACCKNLLHLQTAVGYQAVAAVIVSPL